MAKLSVPGTLIQETCIVPTHISLAEYRKADGIGNVSVRIQFLLYYIVTYGARWETPPGWSGCRRASICSPRGSAR